MSDPGGISYTAKQTAVKKAGEEVTRALNTISDIFKNFQEDYLSLLQENETLRNLVKKVSPPTSPSYLPKIQKSITKSPNKKKSPLTSPKPTSPPPAIPSPVILSSQEDPETPGIVETTQYPIKPRPTPLKLQRVLQPKKTPSTSSKPFNPWPSTSTTPKTSQSQSRVLSLSRKNVSTRINSSGKVEKQTKLVLQPLTTKTDMKSILNTTKVDDLDPKDLEIDETMFEKPFSQEDHPEIVESSPNENLLKKGRLRLKMKPEPQKPKIDDDIVISDSEFNDMEPSLSQVEKNSVKLEEKLLKKRNDMIFNATTSPALVENINFLNFGQETRSDMDETYFPRAEAAPGDEKRVEEEENPSKRKNFDQEVQKTEDKVFDMVLDGDWDTDVSMDKWSPPQKKKLMNSFDQIPEKKKKSPTFAYKGGVVRNKAERAKLKGWSCKECEVYYKNMDLTEEDMKRRMDQCSRHRSKFNERYCTPPGFWNPVIDDTPADHE